MTEAMHPSDESAFDLLHSDIQRALYRMAWKDLRPIQVEAIRSILRSKCHIILAARTASGKTEAAFLPILSHILAKPTPGLRVMYLSPLKALINDQFRRLEDLCKETSIPVHRWHGDVGQADRKTLLESPSGVLLITPESVEATFINRPHDLDRLFSCIEFVVIDELHCFLESERGAHLKSLLSRIRERTRAPFRLIGLSATLGDPRQAMQWLAEDEESNVQVIEDASETASIRIRMQAYVEKALATNDCEEEDSEDESQSQQSESSPEECHMATDLFHQFRGKTGLIFGNSKSQIEFFADLVRREEQRRRLPNAFFVHHGSLSKAERELAEEELHKDRPTVVFCSSTLEMGIDVGNVDIIGQIGSPWSVNSLAQRLGRSGRKQGQASTMRMYLPLFHSREDGPFLNRLYPSFLQAVAMTELMLEKWCEPPDVNRLHLSTLIHQSLSTIAEHGGIKAEALFELLVRRGAFSNVSRPIFTKVLRGLGAKDLIEQSPEGDLILGLRGEKIVRHYEFYAAFQTSAEAKVFHQERCIGSVAPGPDTAADRFLILAGRRWKILSFDPERNEIHVVPARGGRQPHFAGSGSMEVHERVRQKMLEVLLDSRVPVYLDEAAKALLERARLAAQHAGLGKAAFYQDGADTLWFTWTSSRINRTLQLLINQMKGLSIQDEGTALRINKSTLEQAKAILSDISPPEAISPEMVTKTFPTCAFEKYDHFLPEDLQAEAFAWNRLDLPRATELLRRLTASPDSDAACAQ